jgi:hypothetical protein
MTHLEDTAIAPHLPRSTIEFHDMMLVESLPAPLLPGSGIAGGTSTLNNHKQERRLTLNISWLAPRWVAPAAALSFPLGMPMATMLHTLALMGVR